MRESNFQSKLVDEIKKQGHRVKKMQSGMGYVVLDLYVRHSELGAQWWELKTLPSLGRKIGLTQLQRNEIRDEVLAGGSAACVVCVKTNNTESIYVMGMEDSHVKPENHVQDRRIGQSYDVTAIASAVFVESERLRVRATCGESFSCGEPNW